MRKTLKLVGAVLLALLIAAGIGWALGNSSDNDEELKDLKAEISLLRDGMNARADSLEELSRRITRADEATAAARIRTRQEVRDADVAGLPVVEAFRARIAHDPALLQQFAIVEESYESRIRTRDEGLERQERSHTLALAERDAKIATLERQVADADSIAGRIQRQSDIYKSEARPSFAIRFFRGAKRIAYASLGAYVGDQLAPESDLAPALGAAAGVIVYEATD